MPEFVSQGPGVPEPLPRGSEHNHCTVVDGEGIRDREPGEAYDIDVHGHETSDKRLKEIRAEPLPCPGNIGWKLRDGQVSGLGLSV